MLRTPRYLQRHIRSPHFLEDVPACNANAAKDVLQRVQNALGARPGENDPSFEHMYATPGDGNAVGFDESPDQWAENAEGDEDDSDDEDEDVDMEDATTLLEEGANNVLNLQAKEVVAVPRDVANVQVKACSSFRSIWTEGYDPSITQRLEAANGVIRDRNRLGGRNSDAFIIPYREIAATIPVIRSMASKWASAKAAGSTELQSRYSKDTACIVLSLLGTIAPTGMSWKFLVPTEVRHVLTDIMQEGISQIDARLQERVMTYINRDQVLASPVQAAIVNQAKEPLKALIRCARGGNLNGADAELEKISKINDELKASNRELCLKDNDHLLPMEDIGGFTSAEVRQMEAQARKDHVDRLTRFAARYLHEIGYLWLAQQLKKTPSRVQLVAEDETKLQQSVGPRLLEFRDPVDETRTSPEDPEAPSDTSASASRVDNSSQETPSDTSEVQPQTSSSEVGTTGNVRGQTDVTGLLRQSSVDGIHYANGITTFGKIDHIQCVRKGAYRVFVNVGTENLQVYKSYPGSALGRGMAEEMAGGFPNKSAEPDFIKDRKANHVKKIKAIVEVDQKTPEPKRAPITKYLVQWNSEKVTSEDKWITRSELIAITSKEYDEQCRAILLNDWRHNLDVLDRMRRENKHPETGQPLQESDRERTPWLFQQSQPNRTSGRRENSRNNSTSEENAPPPPPESRRFGS